MFKREKKADALSQEEYLAKARARTEKFNEEMTQRIKECGQWIIDNACYLACADEERIQLSPVEINIIIENAGRIEIKISKNYTVSRMM